MPIICRLVYLRFVQTRRYLTSGIRRGVGQPSSPVQRVTVLLAVRKDDGASVGCTQWLSLRGRGIYIQALEETEGDRMWQSGDRICRLGMEIQGRFAGRIPADNPPLPRDTHKAGPNSQRRGTNQSTAPIAGFESSHFRRESASRLCNGSQNHRVRR